MNPPRRYVPDEHIVNLQTVSLGEMVDDQGDRIANVVGGAGAAALSAGGVPIGVDRIRMLPGGAFPLHTHEGDHLLYVLSGIGTLHVDGVDYTLRAGDSVFVPAEYPHGVGGPLDDQPLEFLAFGIPHHPIDSHDRMSLVREPESNPPVWSR